MGHESAVDIAHGDRTLDGRAKAARGHDTDNISGLVSDLRAFTGRCPLEAQADTFLTGLVLNLLSDDVRAREVTTLAAGLGHGPDQRGLDRRAVLVHVMTIKAKAGFQSQTVTRTKADSLHFVLSQQKPGNSARIRLRNGNLETVLARISGAGDQNLGTV